MALAAMDRDDEKSFRCRTSTPIGGTDRSSRKRTMGSGRNDLDKSAEKNLASSD
jgi:hypothetical protein